jgi:prevent-host-death family protein
MIIKGPIREITAEEFAERCLELIDEVRDTGEELIVTREGTPAVQVMAAARPNGARPSLIGSVKFNLTDDEFVHFGTEAEWEALN